MPMTAKGLSKLIEECGELTQVAGKKLAYYHTDEHPDGEGSLKRRLENEIADVIAAARFVIEMHGLDDQRVISRIEVKERLFREWHADPTNNMDGIDRGRFVDLPTYDLTPKSWSIHTRDEISAVIRKVVEELDVVNLTITRRRLDVTVKSPGENPERIEALRSELYELGPHRMGGR